VCICGCICALCVLCGGGCGEWCDTVYVYMCVDMYMCMRMYMCAYVYVYTRIDLPEEEEEEEEFIRIQRIL